MSRPGDKPNWINDNTTDIEIPTPAEQDAGWSSIFTTGLKPPRQWFNWFQNRSVLWRRWNSGQAGEYIVIDSTAGNEDERDFETLADYIADSPAAGDKVLVKTSQVLTVQMIIPDGVTLRILNGVNFTRSTLEAASVIKLGSNIIIEGVLNLILSQAGTTAKGIEIDGDNNFGDIIVENSSTGTLTDAFTIAAGAGNNHIRGIAKNTGGGILTKVLIDSSAVDSNNVIIVNEPDNKLEISRGLAAAFTEDYILIEDQRIQNTPAGTFAPAVFQTRPLNQIVTDIGGHVSLSSNQITLVPGTYRFRASAPAHAVDGHQIKLFNITDVSDTKIGTSEKASGLEQTRSFVSGRFTIASSKVFELQHKCITLRNTDGFGKEANLTTEIYARIELWKEI